MKFLSLDTSTAYSVVSLSNENGLMCGARRLFEKGRSDRLLSLVAHCLEKAKTQIDEVDYFAVGVGPGSFTGLRIGISTVKGLSYALRRPCLAFSSLDAIAFNGAFASETRLCVMVDARRANVYCRFYASNGLAGDTGASWRRFSPAMLLNLKTFQKRVMLEAQKEKGMAFCGDAVRLYRGDLLEKNRRFRFMPEESWYPTPESLAHLAKEGVHNHGTVDPFGLSAAYLYEQDCQINKKCV